SQFDDIDHEWTITNGINEYTYFSQNPVITFNDAGLFSVTLSVTTLDGTFTLTKQGYILVAEAPVASCTPTSSNPSNNYGFTVNKVELNTISKSTSTGFNGVYQDFS